MHFPFGHFNIYTLDFACYFFYYYHFLAVKLNEIKKFSIQKKIWMQIKLFISFNWRESPHICELSIHSFKWWWFTFFHLILSAYAINIVIYMMMIAKPHKQFFALNFHMDDSLYPFFLIIIKIATSTTTESTRARAGLF